MVAWYSIAMHHFKYRLKRQGLQSAQRLGMWALLRRLTAGRARILAYHGVADEVCPVGNFDGFFVSVRQFTRQLEAIARFGPVWPLSRVVDYVCAGRPLPTAVVTLTFDDGYLNNAQTAAPLLKKFGMPATFFVTTGFIDGTAHPWWAALRARGAQDHWDRGTLLAAEAHLRTTGLAAQASALAGFGATTQRTEWPAMWRMMSWDDIRGLAAAGHEIGGHTVHHPSLAHESSAVIQDEIRTALERIKAEIGSASSCFAYPYGRPANVSQAAMDAVAAAGCKAAVTTTHGLNRAHTPRMALRRISVTDRHDHACLSALLAGCPGLR